MGDWRQHRDSWNCNRFDPGDNTRETSRKELARYIHFLHRYEVHRRSAELDHDFVEKLCADMSQMQEEGEVAWTELSFLRLAVPVAAECRQVLKWTYAMAFYLERDNLVEIFEDNQRDLERAVEDLSDQFQAGIQPETLFEYKRHVMDLVGYVTRRREIMLKDTLDGYAEGR